MTVLSLTAVTIIAVHCVINSDLRARRSFTRSRILFIFSSPTSEFEFASVVELLGVVELPVESEFEFASVVELFGVVELPVELEFEADGTTPEFSVIHALKCDTAVKQ